MFKGATNIDKYYEAGKKHGKTYTQMQGALTRIEVYQAAYGDWTLYRDDDGNLWEAYTSLGD